MNFFPFLPHSHAPPETSKSRPTELWFLNLAELQCHLECFVKIPSCIPEIVIQKGQGVPWESLKINKQNFHENWILTKMWELLLWCTFLPYLTSVPSTLSLLQHPYLSPPASLECWNHATSGQSAPTAPYTPLIYPCRCLQIHLSEPGFREKQI